MIKKYLLDENARKRAQEFETGGWVTSQYVRTKNLLDNLVKAYQTTCDVFFALEECEADKLFNEQMARSAC